MNLNKISPTRNWISSENIKATQINSLQSSPVSFKQRKRKNENRTINSPLLPLPHCNLCRIHMAAGRIIKHRWTEICINNTHMRWRRRDVEIAENFTEETFSPTGEDGAEIVEGVELFKYLGRPLDRSDDNWPEVLRSIRKARQVWGHIGKLLGREGADLYVS